ncbi:hypothetical protein JCM1840_002345 [Sporobolomyces johnsonii]
MASPDPLSDPLSAAHTDSEPLQRPALPASTPSWRKDELFAEPFGSAAWGDAADERDEAKRRESVHKAEGDEHAGQPEQPQEEDEEESFTYPTPSHARSTTLNAQAAPFSPPFSMSSPTSPISMPIAPASSLSRTRTASTSGVAEVASSVTPKGVPSPFSRFDSHPEPFVNPSPGQPEEPSVTPSQLGARPALVRTRSTSSNYDPTVLRNLISTACSAGDLERLEALMLGNPSAGGEDMPSAFALANQTSSHTGLAPIHYAAQRGHLDVVRWLVEEAGAMAELEDGDGETALHKAALNGHLDVCQFLLSVGVNVDAADGDGWTALHNASSKGYLDVARLLVDAGASIDQRSKHGYTPLMNAASKGQLPVVHYLIKRGAGPLLRNDFGETAYDLAAAVFEVSICSVLSNCEAAKYASTESTDSSRPPYNPLSLHSTVPIVLFENQRLALPTLKKLSSLGNLAAGPRWTSKALSRNDSRAAFTIPPLVGTQIPDADERACFRSEVGLPVVGKENDLVVPGRREVRSGGRVRVSEGTVPPPSRKKLSRSSTVKASTSRSSASSSLTAVLASSPSVQPSNSALSASSGEPAFIWLSDWVVDLSSQSSSPHDGWSYANSFEAPPEEWSPEPPAELQNMLSGAAALGMSGKKWVRRRRWVRVMRRRLDLPDWGYADLPPFPRRTANAASSSSPTELTVSPSMDYRARAQFLAGSQHAAPNGVASDRASIRSGKTVMPESPEEPLDEVGLRKVAARLERAADELRRGMVSDEDVESRKRAEDELEAFLHRLALIRAELGTNEDEDDDDDDDNQFIYSGKDAGDDDDDARSIWTSARPPSVSSHHSNDCPQPVSSTSTSAAATSPYPDLTSQLAQAPNFRIPTHETAPVFMPAHGTSGSSRSIRPVWEPDESASECRRCGQTFTFFKRKHHCRRCGLVVCASCSTHNDQLDPYLVVREPGIGALDDQPWQQGVPNTYRTCDSCHAALSLPQGVGSASLLSPQAFFPASPSLGSVTPSETGASEASELTECPVCGVTLLELGERSKQEEHVKECLETGGGSIASGRYLVFKLPPGPLVGEECRVCFEEFEVDNKMARLVCLCTFHESCISAWLSRGHSCPVHATREG